VKSLIGTCQDLATCFLVQDLAGSGCKPRKKGYAASGPWGERSSRLAVSLLQRDQPTIFFLICAVLFLAFPCVSWQVKFKPTTQRCAPNKSGRKFLHENRPKKGASFRKNVPSIFLNRSFGCFSVRELEKRKGGQKIPQIASKTFHSFALLFGYPPRAVC
jgi:hypothetical protein